MLCACSVFGNRARLPWTGKTGHVVGTSSLLPGRSNTRWMDCRVLVAGARRGGDRDELDLEQPLLEFCRIGGTLGVCGG